MILAHDHDIRRMFAPAVILVGYVQTTVTVLESDGVAQLQLSVTILAAQLDASFSLLVNTSDGTATGTFVMESRVYNSTIVGQ